MKNKRFMVALAAVAVVHLVVGVAIFVAYSSGSPANVPPVIQDDPGRTTTTDAAVPGGGDNPLPARRPGEVQALNETVHIVKPGDTYWGLARQYGVSVQKLREYNGHSSSHVLKTNERLRIPPR